MIKKILLIFILVLSTSIKAKSENSVSTEGGGSPIIYSEGGDVNVNFGGKYSKSNSSTNNEKLVKIFLGANRSYLESLFGLPMLVFPDDDVKSKTSNFYSFENFYLQLLFENNKLYFYSVTSKNSKFKPIIPKIDLKLGDNTFSQITEDFSGPENYTYLYSYLSFDLGDFIYVEYQYPGKASNYKNIYLSYNSFGHQYSKWIKDGCWVKNEPEFCGSSKEELNKFRNITIPNTYGVGYFDEQDALISKIGIKKDIALLP